ncbi:TetR family transcriptional regulator [Martelella soudanensis]|uniref:TetR family transcriptional regulator n=1 Tax=unclassified Martelella TaxID=2629616 RepID=UPI0015DE82CC|nr:MULTISPECIES: TetR family transcriptional regulator [unclassified Martelella]
MDIYVPSYTSRDESIVISTISCVHRTSNNWSASPDVPGSPFRRVGLTKTGAASLYAAEGFAATSMEQIASQCGASDPAFLPTRLLYAASIRPLMSQLLGEPDFEEAAAQDAYFCRAWDLFRKGAAARG